MRFFTFVLLTVTTACASSQKCPDVSEEAVSSCRAEVACGKGKFSTALAMILGGMGAGASGSSRNQASDNYDTCVARNLSAQKANAGLQDNTQHCTSRRVADDRVETDCH
jgi:hypothetical protein